VETAKTAKRMSQERKQREYYTKKFLRPSHRPGRVQVSGSVDKDVRLTLDMLGFDVPALIEELLQKVADSKRCPCCGQFVKPQIVATKLDL